jgi:hypothetical protein
MARTRAVSRSANGSGEVLLAFGRQELLGAVLLALASAQLVFHLWGDLRRKT